MDSLTASDRRAVHLLRRVSGRSLARLLHEDPSMISRWTAMGMPRRADGSYDALAVLAWCHLERRGPWSAGPNGRPHPREVRDLLAAILQIHLDDEHQPAPAEARKEPT